MNIPDILDLNRYYFDTTYDFKIKNKSIFKYILISLIRMISSVIIYPINDLRNFKKIPIQNKIWVYVRTTTQYNSIKGIEKYNNDIVYLNTKGYVGDVKVNYLPKTIKLFVVPISILYCLCYFIINFKLFIRFLYGFHDVIYTIPRLINYYILINIFKPKMVIILNDFKSEYLTLCYSAKVLNLRTVFIPHSMSHVFSEFECYFDKYLVYGNKQIDDYCKIGNADIKKFKIVGSVRHSYINRQERRKIINIVTIAINVSTDMNIIDKLIYDFKRNTDKKIILRPHPGQIIQNKAKYINIDFSDPETENINDIFDRSDCVISYNSNILVDAAYAGLLSLSYKLVKYDSGTFNLAQYNICRTINGIEEFEETITSYDRIMKIQKNAVEYLIANKKDPIKNIADNIII